MKKSLVLLTALAFSSAAMASQLTLSASHATVNNGYPDATNEHALADFNLGTSTISIEADHLHEWGQTSTFGNLDYAYQFNSRFSASANFGGSSLSNIAPHTTWGVMGNVSLLAHKNLVASVGYERLQMSSGLTSATVNLQGVYYVPGVPLALQANYFFVRNKGADSRNGHRIGVAATWGHVGHWTAGVSYDYGRVDYSLANFFPLASANYTSSTLSGNVRYWVTRRFGVLVDASRVKNRYYNRNSIGAGVFMNF